MKKAAFFNNTDSVKRVYAQGREEQVAAAADLYPVIITSQNFAEHQAHLGDLEVIFSTWGMPALTPEQLKMLPSLRAVFYAAGSVQGFARPLLERGVQVVSAWAANAVPVAEFALAQILMAGKGYFRNTREYHAGQNNKGAYHGKGNFGETVALLGCGQIGRALVGLLQPFQLRIVVYDPFLGSADAERLGVALVSLEEAFALGSVVSNHLANLPETVGMLNGTLFERMRPNATFINTGRGATVAEAEMIRVLQARPDLTALLDVTYPEPPASGALLYSLPNVQMTTHIAGSLGDEVVRMADYMLAEFRAWERGEPLRYAVTLEMLATMA